MALMNGKAEDAATAAAAAEQGAGQDGIRAFDQDGNEVVVPREEWRNNVLPGMLKEVWDEPEQLYLLIVNSLNDGFTDEVREAAEHLYKTDPLAARGACMWAISLMQAGRVDEAQQVLEGYGQEHGEDAAVLVNLAKVYASRGEEERAETTLWRALEVEPNIENGVGWYAARAQERGGEGAAREALEKIAGLPGSWRALLWLARGELAADGVEQARELYGRALERAPRPVPGDFLMQMSGDLGGHGQLGELIEMTAPHFVAEAHGLPVGNNLMKAYVDTGRLDEAEAIKNTLYGFGRPDWKDALAYWDTEIARRRVGNANEAGVGQGIQIGMLRVDGPVWLPAASPARGLFGAKAAGAAAVTFLGGTAEVAQGPTEVELQMADAVGRMTRALPLFLAEQTEMRTAAVGRAMLPWAVGMAAGQPSGFVVSGARWPDEVAVQAVGDPANACEYVVTVHVDAEVEPWTAALGFVRVSDGARIGELEAEFMPGEAEAALRRLGDEVVELLGALGAGAGAERYEVPAGGLFGQYLLRLEQLLAVRCAGMEGVAAHFLNGEREIVEGGLGLCESEPDNVPARLLLVETMGAMQRVRPEVAEEFRVRFGRFVEEHPLALVDRVFAAASA